ncbi:hypothetical protein B0H10DRAFT_458545 [Mycena sp. CBHHK59/15]|nr:hypothetical protein B0H10DRAFT_458545 [Mycena sp. CBHHK59/15]
MKRARLAFNGLPTSASSAFSPNTRSSRSARASSRTLSPNGLRHSRSGTGAPRRTQPATQGRARRTHQRLAPRRTRPRPRRRRKRCARGGPPRSASAISRGVTRAWSGRSCTRPARAPCAGARSLLRTCACSRWARSGSTASCANWCASRTLCSRTGRAARRGHCWSWR